MSVYCKDCRFYDRWFDCNNVNCFETRIDPIKGKYKQRVFSCKTHESVLGRFTFKGLNDKCDCNYFKQNPWYKFW